MRVVADRQHSRRPPRGVPVWRAAVAVIEDARCACRTARRGQRCPTARARRHDDATFWWCCTGSRKNRAAPGKTQLCEPRGTHTLSILSFCCVGVMFCVELCGVLHLFRLVVMLRLLRPNQFAPLLFLQYSCVVVAIKFQKNQNSSIFLFSKQKKKLFAMLIFPSAVFHAMFHRDNLKDKIDLTSFVHRKASRKGNKFSNASSLGLVPNQFEIGIAFSIFAKTETNPN